ncbi:hypothetical protein QU487_02480 [Crenobacter sp. SG2305]|uniref:hypothetical protein n=1 Tax=Crenobacter oryzisoli TaxID=3056844 RepID=UPI0025AA802C|nr:hypothetical protein [Crenobacter sp. SG2305]MDN0081627.1 hypothetical protein [Crenobacter sp. SG2305]
MWKLAIIKGDLSEMRKVSRVALPTKNKTYLTRRHNNAMSLLASGQLNIDSQWKSARQTKNMDEVLVFLKVMAGGSERCMYCMDSHGSDIEHFFPKADYPRYMFKWKNYLLCCSECGRIKGSRFPLAGNRPLLINPIVMNPWSHLDFDPTTGAISAKYLNHKNDFSIYGVNTVETLKLDSREYLRDQYRKTFTRIRKAFTDFVHGLIDRNELVRSSVDLDDHYLMGWVFDGTGQNVVPFITVRDDYPVAWDMCYEAFKMR